MLDPNAGRKPFVSFKQVQVEDRENSVEAGHRVVKLVDYIEIVPHGSEGKTKIPYIYSEWKARNKWAFGEDRFDSDNRSVPMQAARFPVAWYHEIEAQYQAWKKGHTIDKEGHDLRIWAPINEAQLQNAKHIHIDTVEELASCSDEACIGIGIGGTSLRQTARDFLEHVASGSGKLAGELEHARVRVSDQQLIIDQQAAKIRELEKGMKGAKQSSEA